MTVLAADHSTGGAIIGGSLRKEGFEGIIRYAAGGRTNVNINASEYQDLVANEIPVGIVIEHESTWLVRSPASVTQLVEGAREVWRRAGIPDGVAYLAADFDATGGGPTFPGSRGDQTMHAIMASLHAAAGVLGEENVGFYGSPFAIDWLIAHEPWLRWFWDTEAWGKGRPPHPRAQLYQRAQSKNIAGVNVDVDVILKPDWGQRVHPRHGIAPPKKKHHPTIHRPKTPIHPKVQAATLTAGITTGIEAALHAAGVKLTPAESGGIVTIASFIAGYVKAGGKVV